MTDAGRRASSERRSAERRVGWARLWARAKQIVTSDPTGSDDDDHVPDEEAARVLARSAGQLKGGLAKVAQLAAYDPGATLGGQRHGLGAVASRAFERLDQQGIARIEMGIEAAVRESGFLHDIGHAHTGVAALADRASGHGDDALVG